MSCDHLPCASTDVCICVCLVLYQWTVWGWVLWQVVIQVRRSSTKDYNKSCFSELGTECNL